jgi:hypothetical protein
MAGPPRSLGIRELLEGQPSLTFAFGNKTMKLTAKESKLVERLRKHDRRWRLTRWVLIIGGVALIAVWAWMLRYVFDSTEDSRDKEAALLLHAFAYPKVLFGMIIGALMIAFALRDWYGSPTRTLLLRLLEEHQAEPFAPPNGGPATPRGNSGVTEGPPSVS